MKTVIVAALTIDGFISRDATSAVNWTSKADKQHFRAITKEIGTMVVGSRTFDTFNGPMPDRRTIVMTRRPEAYQMDGLETYTGSVVELYAKLEAEGLQELAIIGGSEIYGQFLNAGLVDELVLTIEPKLFGSGISLSSLSLDLNPILTSSERLGDNSVLLRYKLER